MSDLFSIVPTPSSDGVPTISSLQIAEITGKRHDNVMRDIKATLEEAGIGLLKFEGTYRNNQNKEQPCYYLPRRECDLIVTGYKPVYRLAIIDRWQELEAKQSTFDPAAFLSDPAAMRGLLLTYTEKVISLEAMVSEQKPKVDALNLISTADGSLCITDAAKALQARRKDLFHYLSENGWIYRRAGCKTWLGYSTKESQGLIEHKVTTRTVDGVERIMEQVRITPKGLAKLAEMKMEGRAA